MAWIIRKLIITMLVPYLWRRWRERPAQQDVRQSMADPQLSSARARG